MTAPKDVPTLAHDPSPLNTMAGDRVTAHWRSVSSSEPRSSECKLKKKTNRKENFVKAKKH